MPVLSWPTDTMSFNVSEIAGTGSIIQIHNVIRPIGNISRLNMGIALTSNDLSSSELNTVTSLYALSNVEDILDKITTGQDENYTGATDSYYEDFIDFTKLRLYVKREGPAFNQSGTYVETYRNYWMRDQVDVATFNGSSYMEISYTSLLNTPQFTVAVWVYVTNTIAYQRLFDSFYLDGSTRYGYHVKQDNTSNRFTFMVRRGNVHNNEFVYKFYRFKRVASLRNI